MDKSMPFFRPRSNAGGQASEAWDWDVDAVPKSRMPKGLPRHSSKA